ncbi:MAG: CsgG/HfaB family protein [Armatimonadota bacterium]
MRRTCVRGTTVLIAVFLVLGVACGGMAAPAKGKAGKGAKAPERILKKRIAVLPIDVALAPGSYRRYPSSVVAGLTDMLTTALRETGRFIVVERARLEGILGEQQLADQGIITPETVPQRGKVLGAEYLIAGDLTEFEHAISGAGSDIRIKGYRIGGDRERAHLAIDARVVDVNTSEVLAAKRVSGSAVLRAARLGLPIGSVDIRTHAFQRSALGKAMRSAVGKWVRFTVEELGSEPWQGRVAKVASSSVYINGGTDIGIRQGDRFEVVRPGEALTDPATGLELARELITIGTIRVTQAYEKYSVGEIVSGELFQRGDIVRAIARGQADSPSGPALRTY